VLGLGQEPTASNDQLPGLDVTVKSISVIYTIMISLPLKVSEVNICWIKHLSCSRSHTYLVISWGFASAAERQVISYLYDSL